MKARKKSNGDITVGEKIRFYRQRLRLTQEELALSTGLGLATISDIENNVFNPRIESIHRLAVALNLSAKEIAYVFGVNLYVQGGTESK